MIFTVVGARPNFMKAAPIHHAFAAAGLAHAIVHTGQHYDEKMSRVFFDDLGMPKPIVDLGVGSGSHAEQTAAIMIGFDRFLDAHPARAVLVVGDVNSTMAATLVCAKRGVFVAHVEAGLRSGDRTMPEEINRIVTDALADLLLTPSADADANLRAEGRPVEAIVRVGNVMIDSLLEHLPRARALAIPARMGLDGGRDYAVVTLHRPATVDDPAVLAPVLTVVARLAARLPVVFPVHPRTRTRLQEPALARITQTAPGLHVMEPLGYLEFLSLSSGARLVLTDSGGLQEETTVLGIPCLTLRTTTERPVTVTDGTNTIVGLDPDRIQSAIDTALARPRDTPTRRPDLWDGHAAGRIAAAVAERVGPV